MALEPRVPEEDHDLDLTTESGTEDLAVTLQRPSFVQTKDPAAGAKPVSRSGECKKEFDNIMVAPPVL